MISAEDVQLFLVRPALVVLGITLPFSFVFWTTHLVLALRDAWDTTWLRGQVSRLEQSRDAWRKRAEEAERAA